MARLAKRWALSDRQRKQREDRWGLHISTGSSRPICFAVNNAKGCHTQGNKVHVRPIVEEVTTGQRFLLARRKIINQAHIGPYGLIVGILAQGKISEAPTVNHREWSFARCAIIHALFKCTTRCVTVAASQRCGLSLAIFAGIGQECMARPTPRNNVSSRHRMT